MKSRTLRIFVAGAALLIVVLGYLLWSQKSVAPEPPTTPAPVTTPTNNAPAHSSPTASTPATPPPVIPHKPDLPPGQNKEDSMSKVLNVLNEQPINFYGKVIDQYNNPVSGVTVIGTAAHSRKFMEETFDSHTTTSDANGLFHFEGLSGMGLGINLKKDGYEYSSNTNSFNYSAVYTDKERHHPDANAPVIFKMWKQQGPQNLTPLGLSAYVPCDGSVVSFDLVTGRRAPSGGDVTVSFTRNPVKLQGANRYDWKLVVNVANGGVVAMNDQYPNEAPADGYQSQIVIDMPKDATPWLSQVTRNYYLKIRGQDYGRINFYVTTGFDEPPMAGLGIKGYMNPTGSRNLEAALPPGKGK